MVLLLLKRWRWVQTLWRWLRNPRIHIFVDTDQWLYYKKDYRSPWHLVMPPPIIKPPSYDPRLGRVEVGLGDGRRYYSDDFWGNNAVPTWVLKGPPS